MEISRLDIESNTLQKFDKPFLKIPIDKYLELIHITPVPPQIALINSIQNPKYRFITAVLSRRTGKTWISNVIGHLVTLIPGCNILIIAPNYSLATISWELQQKFVRTFNIETSKNNSKDRVMELANGSSIRMGSINQVDSVIGRSYDLIIFDECAVNEDGAEAFGTQLRPTLDKVNSKAIFISTPRGKNWFYEFYKQGFSEDYPTWISIRSTYKDNPRASKEDIEDAKRTLSKAEFAQEYECEFTALEGQIYYLNKDNIVDVDVSNLHIEEVIGGLDLGFRDATAFIVIYNDGYNYYIVDEYLKAEKATSVYAKSIKEMIEKYSIDMIYIDSAAQQLRYDLAYEYDISTINAKKSVLDGIGYITSLVDHNRVFVDKKCVHTLEMFENYKWDDRANLIKEKPKHDKYSHIADALRYALYTHSYNLETIDTK